MFKKILTGAFLFIMLGAVVIGAINLFAGSEHEIAHVGANDRSQGAGAGRGRENRELDSPQSSDLERAPGSGAGYGQGFGRNQNRELEAQTIALEQQTIEGIVIETEELVVKTRTNETVQVGLGPSHYRDAQGFVLAVGDQVRISGYSEDGELKATHVENLDTGGNITLRDASGRPMWAGQGRGRNRG